ncbi:cilia- and flagella- associated protein 210 [Dunckerocampus dactyliophorus]|uniref:cilia- and flagella- associated protein 210 n=1 Tax=Dunckerocampus dactyliophorus TaxID=161453 RepID=UPI0024052380|nr:cilia- and flagella- associated protein 210 [Dunckerocampus dactyliophorus]
MASVVQHGRRRGSSMSVSPAEDSSGTIQPPDLHQVTILSKADWLRIQGKIKGVDKEKESMMEAMRQRELLQQKSKEMAKLWPNTLACQRQKKLEAKKIRDQMEEDKRNRIDMEEAKYREEQRKEAIEKAKRQLYYQTERVKGLHRALLLTEVLKEREAQMELKQRRKSASKELDKEYVEMMKAREDEALKREQERKQEKRLERQAVAEDLKKQIEENQLAREQQKLQTKKDGEEIQRLQELHQWELKLEEETQAKQKSEFMQAQLEHLAQRDISKAADTEQQEAEEAQRKLFLSAKEKMVKLRRDKEQELLKEVQNRREKIMDKLAMAQQEQTEQQEQRLAKAVAEQDAKRMQQQWEEEERRAAMMKSITAHREHMVQEKESDDSMRKEKERAALQAKKEADRIFSEEQKLKAQNTRQELQKLQGFNACQMVEKQARRQQVRRAEHGFEAKNLELLAEEEKAFEKYSLEVVQAAAAAQRSVLPLYKAVREGVACGPSFPGARPRYLVQDTSGAEMPKYISATTRGIKEIHEVVDIEEAKKRLGFMW